MEVFLRAPKLGDPERFQDVPRVPRAPRVPRVLFESERWLARPSACPTAWDSISSGSGAGVALCLALSHTLQGTHLAELGEIGRSGHVDGLFA